MRIRMLLIAPLAALLVMIAGCGGHAAAPPSPGVSDVTLLAAGTDPQPLRLRLSEGDVHRARMSVRIQQRQTIDGREASLPRQPGQQFTIEATTTSVEDGVATLTFRYPTARFVDTEDVDSELLDQLEPFLRPITGITGTLRITDRGVVLESGLKGLDGLPEAIRPAMEQLTDQLRTLSIPYPEEPVGIGGRWRGTFTVDVAGLRTLTTYTYTLKGRDGDRLEIAAEATQTSEAGDSDGLVPGVEIVSAEGGSRITGSMVADLTSLFPVSSTTETDGTVTMTATVEGRSSTVVARTSGSVELAREGG